MWAMYELTQNDPELTEQRLLKDQQRLIKVIWMRVDRHSYHLWTKRETNPLPFEFLFHESKTNAIQDKAK
jgi:hypothetical protein